MRCMNKTKRRASSLIVALLVCLPNLLTGFGLAETVSVGLEPVVTVSSTPTVTMAATSPTPAATVEATESPEDTSMPLGVADQRVLEAIEQQSVQNQAAFENAQTSGEQYADFYFSGAQTMQGIFTTLSLYCQMPEYAIPTSATLRVSYTASDVILQDYSTLTFYMNGTPFSSCHVLPKGDNEPVVLYVNVPIDLMQNGYNLLEISSYIRLTDDEGCTDDYNGANWVRIADTTCLRVCYEVAEDANAIRYYPYPFVSLMDKTGSHAAVTFSDAADNDEVEAALEVMANLEASLTTQNDVAFCRLSEARQDNVIYFGLVANSPDWILSLLEEETPQTGALIRRAEYNGRQYLIVVSNEKEALKEAAWFICDQTRVKQATGANAYVSVGEAQPFVDAYASSEMALEGQYSLKDMLGHGMSFSGPFHQEITLTLPVAEDYTLAADSRFTLNIRYSENLDFNRSLMTVYWGDDIPMISRKLSANGSKGETISFAASADAIGTGARYMKIAFDLEIQDLDCTPRQMNMPWAYIAEDSTFYLPQGESTSIGLDDLPIPFQFKSRMNDVMIVLSDSPTSNELLLCGRVISMLGNGSNPYGSMTVRRASEFSSTDADYHLVVIGSADNNVMIQKMNALLYFRYNDTMDALQSNDKIILSADYAKEVGVIQILPSPYMSTRTALVISAPSDQSLNILTQRISNKQLRWALDKEAVLLDNYGDLTTYQFTSTAKLSGSSSKPTFTEVVVNNREPMIFLLVGMGCMLLVLLGVILVLLRVRAHKKDEE
ncbi:MAG: cellulose biosynthesis cyclic di-GMP-binding regulatory protein BcsB [Eubacteriales bacterium]|nr:cellulose biosynthesis cyclic di-GMP-binding regulatory protein BcsB [Eubacteriales bacterium]